MKRRKRVLKISAPLILVDRLGAKFRLGRRICSRASSTGLQQYDKILPENLKTHSPESMKQLKRWQNQLQKVTVALLVALLIVVSPLWSEAAQAEDLGIVTAAQEFAKTVTDARSVFGDLSTEADDLLAGFDDIKGLLEGLPDQVAEVGAAPDLTSKMALQSELTTKQQALKTFTQTFSDWIAKAEVADKQYEKTVDLAEDTFKTALKAAETDLKTQTHGSVSTLKQSFKQTSKLISGLADSTTKAASGKGVFVPAQYDAQMATLTQALEEIKSAIAALK